MVIAKVHKLAGRTTSKIEVGKTRRYELSGKGSKDVIDLVTADGRVTKVAPVTLFELSCSACGGVSWATMNTSRCTYCGETGKRVTAGAVVPQVALVPVR